MLTPAITIDATRVRRNLARMAEYARTHRVNVRPHTKTHKSIELARLQLDHGATGLTVAKTSEARVMCEAREDLDLLMAYPPIDAARCEAVAAIARSGCTMRVAVDSAYAIDQLAAPTKGGVTIGVLIDIDVGLHRTGVQSPRAAIELAEHVSRQPGLRLDGVLYYPGHIKAKSAEQTAEIRAVDGIINEVISLWTKRGFVSPIISGGSTPAAYQSHLFKHLTEIRPGTYIFNDMNTVAGGWCTIDDCAARIIATVISNAVPGQVVIDAGSKTLTSDRRADDPANAGFGHVVEYPQAKITKLNEEHGCVDVRNCDRAPALGERVSIIPNHICPCVNLQDRMWLVDPNDQPREIAVDARGKLT